ncbi:ABC-F family ATP-binding cassette domain-containing protein [Emticicia sp. C21]|uniref:ABC-F family ATP-binding cassette domain-containing protein n=1 Tax=Emticicia sp. C21 TaxID=2302915 RepID=UPI000E354D70|nr:ABC-F family ATP-binding cassette domain-containing protein [Emticicia sp. C21]RFS17863.1 ABC transporter ATP-binding protein [Emticicia sp. C21]
MSIIIRSLSYIHSDRETLFQNISFAINKGEKAALVGSNGIGKSTLLQIIAGQLQASAGEVVCGEKPYYVPQHLGQYDDFSIAQALGIEHKLNAYEAILQGDTSADNFTLLNDDWTIEERTQSAFDYWHLQHLSLHQPMHLLSGGEKTKVFLAGILIQEPGIVLLDEPSNHLDILSRELLYEFIKKSKETILLVSHDRTLLNLIALTLELSKNAVETFGGNYDFYKAQKETKLEALEVQLSEKEKKLKQTQQKARELIEQRQKQELRGKSHGQKQNLPKIVAGNLKSKAEVSTAKAKGIQQEKMNEISNNLREIRTQIQEQQVLKIDLKKSDLHKGKILVDAKEVNYGYSDALLWHFPLSFQIRSGDKIRIEGANGSGKTTLLKLITGILEPSIGEVYRAEFKYLYIDQNYSIINNQQTVFEQTQQFNKRRLPEHELKMLLHYHQFPHEVWDRKCAGLSGGEKMKLLLCCLAISNNTPDVLILDEPTNNLDVYSQKVLTEAIRNFSGTLLVISHDQYFIQEIDLEKRIEVQRI